MGSAAVSRLRRHFALPAALDLEARANYKLVVEPFLVKLRRVNAPPGRKGEGTACATTYTETAAGVRTGDEAEGSDSRQEEVPTESEGTGKRWQHGQRCIGKQL